MAETSAVLLGADVHWGALLTQERRLDLSLLAQLTRCALKHKKRGLACKCPVISQLPVSAAIWLIAVSHMPAHTEEHIFIPHEVQPWKVSCNSPCQSFWGCSSHLRVAIKWKAQSLVFAPQFTFHSTVIYGFLLDMAYICAFSKLVSLLQQKIVLCKGLAVNRPSPDVFGTTLLVLLDRLLNFSVLCFQICKMGELLFGKHFGMLW